jgi:hypothetical protein
VTTVFSPVPHRPQISGFRSQIQGPDIYIQRMISCPESLPNLPPGVLSIFPLDRWPFWRRHSSTRLPFLFIISFPGLTRPRRIILKSLFQQTSAVSVLLSMVLDCVAFLPLWLCRSYHTGGETPFPFRLPFGYGWPGSVRRPLLQERVYSSFPAACIMKASIPM